MNKITGVCFRHSLRFRPSEQFNNNCPARYWESQAKNPNPRPLSECTCKRDFEGHLIKIDPNCLFVSGAHPNE